MKIDLLQPAVEHCELFTLKASKFVPAASGCYVLASADDTVLYVGLATNLNRRVLQHLDAPEKVLPTVQGRAVRFHWLETTDINRVERTWLNIHVHHEGRYPVLNKVYSPT